jgi:Putative auto-transporter adhesin, head GIN domain
VKIFIILIVGVVIATLAAVATLATTRRHAAPVGESQRERRPLATFNRIEVDGMAEVRLRQGSTEGATIEAPARLVSRIRTEVRAGTLFIDVAQERQWSDWLHWSGVRQTPRVTVDFIKLDRLESAGAVKLAADSLSADELRLDFSGASSVRIGNLQASTLHLEGSGATKVDLAGRVGTQVVDLSGAGSYSATHLESDRAEVHVSGAGKAFVNAKTSLMVKISGAGVVEYLGSPKLEQDISGVGKVRRRGPD